MEVVFTSNLPDIAAALARVASEGPVIIASRLGQAADEIRAATVPMLADVTPKRTGELAASTMATVTGGGLSRLIEYEQPELSKPNMSPPSEAVFYGPIVISGRGPIDPVNKKMLASPNWPHPWLHSGPAPPDPYNVRFLGKAEGPVMALLEAYGQQCAQAMVDSL